MLRRTALAAIAGGIATGVSGLARSAYAGEPEVRDEEPEIFAKVREFLERGKVGPLKATPTRYYLSAGDCSFEDRVRIGRYCDGLLLRARELFTRAGLPLVAQGRRLSIVTLGDREAFDRLSALRKISRMGGFYASDLRTSFLALTGPDTPDVVDWQGVMCMVAHEGMHQITYNLGILNPFGDSPPCIREGLAMLGEEGTDRAPNLIGSFPLHLQDGLGRVRTGGVPPEEIFASDLDFYDHKDLDRRGTRYAQSWVTVLSLMTDKELAPKFRAYLKAISPRVDSSRRLDDVREHLGALEDLHDRSVRLAQRLLARPPSRYHSPRRSSRATSAMHAM